ncbi:hypothetical protein AD017_32425 (plasmid) [Pseudonocardia sp. EC080619-01]|uniref:IS1096 element passenger TnpR family protein n=1 Tax=Pseudonocardia sp. EC080619-01 TaxID=1096856 RepID=UPI000705AB43|nr:hypothetical protein [Pseudonocardia sp. EC080619-01]ALL85854.1 hypothetical protein AD017_32425 [Pseudonocardia sp. EC080619-01]
MARRWWSIRVDLVEGGGDTIWPRPGRVFAAARMHSFAALATAIDDAFARWDRAHLHEFELADGTRIGQPDPTDPELAPELLDTAAVRLSRLQPGQQFVYVFDLGDRWTHLCTVGPARIDPLDELGIHPATPLPYAGWGTIPDQYGRHFDHDDDQTEPPPDPDLTDLPPLRPRWGRR